MGRHSRRHRWFGLVVALALIGCVWWFVLRATTGGVDVLGCQWTNATPSAECDQ